VGKIIFRNSLDVDAGADIGPTNFSLRLTYPLGVGTVPSGRPANDRARFAYPGIEYNICGAAVGGSFPYTWTLSNEPAGMTIDADTGEISWPNPTSNASNITITVEDGASDTDSATWSIVVSTSGWKFVDATGGSDAAAGTLAAPWETIEKVHTSGGTDRIYFREGTYNLDGLTPSGSVGDTHVEWNDGDGRELIWLGYPGEARPLIDLQSSGTETPYIKSDCQVLHFDHLEIANAFRYGVQDVRGDHGLVIRRCDLYGLVGGSGGLNAALIMVSAAGDSTPHACVVVQGCEFSDTPADWTQGVCTKWYYTLYLLVERTTVTNCGEGHAVKESNAQYTLRQNTFSGIDGQAIGGDWGDNETSHGHYGEICYNNIKDAGSDAIRINQNGDQAAGPTYIYRNTVQGIPRIFHGATGDGPIVIQSNVIVNDHAAEPPFPQGFATDNAPDITVFDFGTGVTANLLATTAAGAVDADGVLVGAYRTSYLGTHGHEIA